MHWKVIEERKNQLWIASVWKSFHEFYYVQSYTRKFCTYALDLEGLVWSVHMQKCCDCCQVCRLDICVQNHGGEKLKLMMKTPKKLFPKTLNFGLVLLKFFPHLYIRIIFGSFWPEYAAYTLKYLKKITQGRLLAKYPVFSRFEKNVHSSNLWQHSKYV